MCLFCKVSDLKTNKKEYFYKYFWTVTVIPLKYVNYIAILSKVVQEVLRTIFI